MLPWLLLILFLLLFIALGTLVFGAVLGRGGDLDPLPAGEEVIRANRAAIAGGEPEALRFNLSLRGYRPAEVDAALADLAARIRELEERTAVPRGTAGAPVADRGAASAREGD